LIRVKSIPLSRRTPSQITACLRRGFRHNARVAPDPAIGALFDRLPDVVFFAKDRQGRYQHANTTLTVRCGKRHKDEILGRTAAELFPGALGEAYSAQDRQVLRTGVAIEDKLELHLYASGHEGWCLTYKIPVRDANGTVIGLVGISRDVHRPDERHPEYARLARAVDTVRSRYGETVRLQSLARRVGLSVSRFERLVRQIFQLTPRQLLIKTRIEAASRLLVDQRLTIAQVAQACGYSDHSAFTRQFRATVGLTPGAFRGRQRGAGESSRP
jgi:PAS domain S-box-containing protein